jgi:tRNA modification GTPase
MTTIFAPINNHINSSVCTIRISGENIFAVSKFIPNIEKIEHRKAMRVKILNENGEQIDDAIALFFQNPKSFTGEDVLEISLHSSSFIVSKFLAMLASLPNFAFAKNGEFCMRAVQNGKISLTQAEGINKLILSQSHVQHKLAINELNGICKDYYDQIKKDITKAIALLETFIDFSEEEAISFEFLEKIEEIRQKLVKNLEKTIKFSQKKENFDVQIAILGKPNVGKSSLFNAITETSDAIVSQIAGTTRDAIRKTVNISGFKVEFVDTAGIRTSNDEIEQIGIERAKEIAKKADVILLLKEFASDEIAIENFTGEIITVFTKSDIYPKRQCETNFINISQGNFSALERKIHEILTEQMSQMQSVGFSCNERQKSILLLTKSILEKADLSLPAELLSEQFRLALHNISHLVGEINNEDILGEIFSSFCIGK